MPTFRLHLKTAAGVIRDEDGFHAADAGAARREAVEAAREMLADTIRDGGEAAVQALVVSDEGDREIAVVSLWEVLPAALRRPVQGVAQDGRPPWPVIQLTAQRSAKLVSE